MCVGLNNQILLLLAFCSQAPYVLPLKSFKGQIKEIDFGGRLAHKLTSICIRNIFLVANNTHILYTENCLIK